MHLLTRMIIFMIFTASVPLIVAALSVKTFNTLHQADIDARQNDVLLRVIQDIQKEFEKEPPSLEEDIRDRIKQIITENEIERTGYIYITDNRGKLLAHSRGEAAKPLDLSATPLVGSLLFRGELKTEGQKRYQSYWGESVVGSGLFRQIPELGRQIGIFVELPARDADRIFLELVRQLTLFTALALILTGILGYYLTTTIITPIRELEQSTRRVAEEKFDEPVKIDTGDEMEDLGEAFNTMMKGLKELKELREEFVFVAAHELRTPVTAIKGFIGLVLEDETFKIPDPNKEYLGKALAANERLIRLVDDLLEVAREEAGRLEIEVRPTDIREPIQTVLKELEPLAKEKAVELQYSPSANLPKTLADARRVEEIMTNITGNAIKYMGGAGKITITHEIREGLGSKSLVTHIADTGVGMTKEDQAKLFQKFYRVYNKKTRDVTGTGLGLFIVKKIIEKMNGGIWVESELNKGSTFSFELPLAD